MSYSVLLHDRSPKGYSATLLAWPGLEIEAHTRKDALDQMRAAIVALLADGELIELEISDVRPIISASYHETFGMFRDDPTFPDFLAEVEKYRHQGNNGEND